MIRSKKWEEKRRIYITIVSFTSGKFVDLLRLELFLENAQFLLKRFR